MQIVTGIIVPIITVAATVILTAYFASLQAKKSKLTELKYQYLSKSLDELNCIEIKMLECVRQMASCLMKQNPNDRITCANQIMKELSVVNMHIYSYTTNQAPLNNAIGIDLDLRGLHDKLGKLTRELHNKFEDYLRKPDTTGFTDEANALTRQAQEDIAK